MNARPGFPRMFAGITHARAKTVRLSNLPGFRPLVRMRPLRKGMVMELFNLLSSEHREIRDLLNALITEPDRGRETLLGLQNRFAELFLIHTLLEEKYLYPAFSDLSEVNMEMAERYTMDHERAQVTLRLLTHQPIGSAAWKKLCRQLLEEVQDHTRREEDALFVIMQRSLPPEQLAELEEKAMNFRRAGAPLTHPPLQG